MAGYTFKYNDERGTIPVDPLMDVRTFIEQKCGRPAFDKIIVSYDGGLSEELPSGLSTLAMLMKKSSKVTLKTSMTTEYGKDPRTGAPLTAMGDEVVRGTLFKG